MCYAAPGPRCGPHAKSQWMRSQDKLNNLREQDTELTKEIDTAMSGSSYVDEEALDTLRNRQQDLREKIDGQIDKVISDRDAYRATSAGVKELEQDLKTAQEAKDVRRSAAIQRAYDRAGQEYSHRLFAAKVIDYQKKNLQKLYPNQDASDIAKNLSSEYRALRIAESQANRNYSALCSEQSNDRSEVIQQKIRFARSAAMNAKEQRIAYEKRMNASQCGSEAITSIRPEQMGRHQRVFISVSPQDFGIARGHFPNGALIEINSVEKDQDGRQVAKLATGDTRLLYRDTVLFADSASRVSAAS